MFKYKTVLLFFLGILLVLITIHFFKEIGYIPYIILCIIFTTILAIGAINIRLGFYIESICRAQIINKSIALTFDDGPTETTLTILDILEKYQIKAAFFCKGIQMEKHPEILRRIDADGHIIGNHSYRHAFWFDLYPYEDMLVELKKTHTLANDITGRKMQYFRPPYGVTNPMLASAIKDMSYTSIGWSLKSLDTMKKNIEKLLVRLQKKINAGDIVLFHDNQPKTPALLEQFIQFALKNNYTFKRLDELINIPAYEKK